MQYTNGNMHRLWLVALALLILALALLAAPRVLSHGPVAGNAIAAEIKG